MRTHAAAVALLLPLASFVALAACGDSTNVDNVPSDAGTTTDSTEGGPANPGEGGTGTSSVDSYLASLPGWPPPKPDSNAPVAGAPAPPPNYVTGTDGVQYACTTTQWSLTSTPTQIVTFNPNVDVLWPGALLQGGPYQKGQLIGLPITQRAPLVISIPTLLSANNSQLVPNPTVASTGTAVGSIINAAITGGVEASSSVSYTQTEAHSTSQVSLALGFSADFVGGNLSAQLNLSQSADLNTVVGYFVQSMFTVTVPQPEQPGDLFQGLTQETLNQLTAKGAVGPTNLPLYVASIVYGRIMMFSITSARSTQEIEAALAAEFHGLVASGSVQTKYMSLINDSSTSFRVVTVGGSAANAEALINTGDPSKFFDSNPAISTGVPISYVVRNLSDNSIAGVSQTTDYAVKTCEATATNGANYYVVDNQATAIDAFDALGNGVTLAHPVTFPSNQFPQGSAIAYDDNDDLLIVLVRSGGEFIKLYKPDGSVAPGGNQTFNNVGLSSISYDSTHGQIYVTGSGGAAPNGIVGAYTPAGQPIGQLPINCKLQTLYVPTTNQLYCFDGPGGVNAFTFGLYQPVTLPANAFQAVYDAMSSTAFAHGEYAAYDTANDRILIGFNTDAWSFTPTGTLVSHFPLQGHIQGLTRDTISQRVAVVLDNGTMQLFSDDGKTVKTINGAFSGIAVPRGLAFRH